MSATIPMSYFADWLASGERGISSEAIVSQLTDRPVGRNYGFAGDYPHDPADLRRCMLLLDEYPLAMLTFYTEMPKRSAIWARLVAKWDFLTALLREEMAENSGKAPRTYAAMREIIAGESA